MDKDLTDEQKIMQQVLQEMQKFSLFASIDLHNNTGRNPHYACINKRENSFYHLALMFSQTVVYFISPDTVQSMAFSKLCPAVTLECGQPGDSDGVSHIKQYLEKVMHLTELSQQPVMPDDIDLYHTIGIVKISSEITFGFNDNAAHINFHKDLENYNFMPLHAETIWAEVADENKKLQVINEQGQDVFDDYYKIKNGQLISTKSLMPAMITLNKEIIRQDCLCYIMEQL